MQDIELSRIRIEDAFWSARQELIRRTAIPYQEAVLNDRVEGVEKSHAIENLRIAAGLSQGEFYGWVFQDSDVAKWLEGAAYSLITHPDPQLEERMDEIIAIIEKAQLPDGYLDTYFMIKEPERRWQNLYEGHEMYCAGHMMEAAAAYYEATGKDALLQVVRRMADHIDARFGPGKEPGVPGHEEVEIGLMRLYQVTGEERYAALAAYFINERGQDPDYFAKERDRYGWNHFGNMDPYHNKENTQSHRPVREQTEAVGHSVRAVYLYTAMAAVARHTGDESLFKACRVLWKNMTQRRMYITGGIGSTPAGEGFTRDYDLPNDTAYSETCAAIGLIFFAREMLESGLDGEYADVMERALFNNVLSGMQLDGKSFFYVNPLEVNPGISGELFGHKHVLPQRPGWHSCACCPPNIVRLIMSLGRYAWGRQGDLICSHLMIGSKVSFDECTVALETGYPWNGQSVYRFSQTKGKELTLAVHVPGYVREMTLRLNGKPIEVPVAKGYFKIGRVWQDGDELSVDFDLKVRRIYANSLVRENAGCTALMRGPFVYALEGVDHSCQLQTIRLERDTRIETFRAEDGVLKGMTLLRAAGKSVRMTEWLYSEQPPVYDETMVTAVPYFAWGNRGLTQMRVWIQEG